MSETFENQNLSLKQRKYFEKIFEILHIPIQIKKIPANLVVPLFKKSSLKIPLWKEIWKLSCQNSNFLNPNEFITCLKFITLAQNNIPLTNNNLEKTKILSLPVFNDLNIIVSNYEHLKEISQKKKLTISEEISLLNKNLQKYKNIIKNKQKSLKVLPLSHNNAKEFFNSYNLHSSILSEIWKLCDFKHKGKLTPGELVVYLHLIEIFNSQKNLPKILEKDYLDFISCFDSDLRKENERVFESDRKIERKRKGSRDVENDFEDDNGNLIYLEKLIKKVERNNGMLGVMKVEFYDKIDNNKIGEEKLEMELNNILDQIKLEKIKRESLVSKIKGNFEKINFITGKSELMEAALGQENEVFGNTLNILSKLVDKDYQNIIKEIKLSNNPTLVGLDSEEVINDVDNNIKNDENKIKGKIEGKNLFIKENFGHEKINLDKQGKQKNLNNLSSDLKEPKFDISNVEEKKVEKKNVLFEPNFDFNNFTEEDDNFGNNKFDNNFNF